LDENNLFGNVVVVNGKMFREQKFHHTCVFVGEDLEDVDPMNCPMTLQFKPCLSVATSGTTNAGLDDPLIYVMI
jgi:hypothetical protein